MLAAQCSRRLATLPFTASCLASLTHTYTHSHTLTHTFSHSHAHTLIHIPLRSFTLHSSFVHFPTLTLTHSRLLTLTHTISHSHKHTYSCSLTLIHAHVHSIIVHFPRLTHSRLLTVTHNYSCSLTLMFTLIWFTFTPPGGRGTDRE